MLKYLVFKATGVAHIVRQREIRGHGTKTFRQLFNNIVPKEHNFRERKVVSVF